jgi:hypothetical protein
VRLGVFDGEQEYFFQAQALDGRDFKAGGGELLPGRTSS